MRRRLALTALVPVVLALGGMSAAQAAPFSGAPSNAHGQCVSESAKAGGQGGRSTVARDKGTCTPPLACTENNDVDRDSRTNTVTIAGSPATLGSSLECETDIEVTAGVSAVSFTFDFADENQTCGGGVPRLFVVIDEVYYNTNDGDPECTRADGDTITYTIPVTGTVTQVGFVYDENDTRSVTYSDATVAGVTLNI